MLVVEDPGVGGEDVLKIIFNVDPESLAADEDGVNDRGAVPGLGMTDEQPVTFADCCGAYGVLHGVVIDGDLAMIEIAAQIGPVVQCIGAGFAKLAFRQGSVS